MSEGGRRKKLQIRDPGPSQCHPSVGRQRPAAGCLPVEILEKAAAALNLKHAPKTGPALRKRLEQELDVPTGHEYSFLSKLPFPPTERAAIAKQYLRPVAPAAWKKDPDMWLDSTNIADVMNQFELSNPRFEFMGPFPIDFAAPSPYEKGPGGAKRCLMNEMCELHVKDAAKNGTDYIGIVYNLDPHFKSGSHWVANFIDLKRKTCHYFDSYGMAPPKQIATFMKWLATQDPEMKLHYNSKRLQFKNSECGVFCLFFLTLMQYGEEFVTIPRSNASDTDMLDYRDWFFST